MKLKYLLVAIMSALFMPVMAIQYEENDTVAVVVDDFEIREGNTVENDTVVVDPDILAVDDITNAAGIIVENYPQEWSELSMQGKLSFEGLPVRPTVKIYMKRGESVIMSARAPIFGEVARVEMCNDSITIINKHTRRYWVQRLDLYTGSNPNVISDIQDIFLGNIAFPGHGRLSRDLALKSKWLATPDNEIYVFPPADMQFAGSEYGLVLDADDYTLLSFVMLLLKSNVGLQIAYLYGDAGWTLSIELEANNNNLGGEIQLSYPDYNPTPLEFTNAGERYSLTDIKGILKF